MPPRRSALWRLIRACYTPRPIAPTGIGAGSGRTWTAHVGTSGATHGRRPARPRAADRAAGHRPRARVEEPGAPVGASLPPYVLIPGELSGGAHTRLHRAVLATGRRGARPVLGAGHHPTPGMRRRPDRG